MSHPDYTPEVLLACFIVVAVIAVAAYRLGNGTFALVGGFCASVLALGFFYTAYRRSERLEVGR